MIPLPEIPQPPSMIPMPDHDRMLKVADTAVRAAADDLLQAYAYANRLRAVLEKAYVRVAELQVASESALAVLSDVRESVRRRQAERAAWEAEQKPTDIATESGLEPGGSCRGRA